MRTLINRLMKGWMLGACTSIIPIVVLFYFFHLSNILLRFLIAFEISLLSAVIGTMIAGATFRRNG